MRSPPQVIVTRRLPQPVEAELVRQYATTLNPADVQFDASALASALRDADVVLCTLTDRFTREVFDAAAPPRAGLLASFGVGFEHIDLEAARHYGIAVTNTPGVLTEDTADLTVLLILAVARRASEGERELRSGRWSGWRPTHLLGSRVHGATLGMVGFGRIGQAVARRAHGGFNMPILYFSPRPGPGDVVEATGAVRCDSVEELLARSDFVSLHCPSTPATRHLLDDARLSLMKQTAFLINTSRGDIVDEMALSRALAERRIAGAALDVYEGEPVVSPALLHLENLVLLPHLGSATKESRTAMGMRALDNIAAFVQGRPLPDRLV